MAGATIAYNGLNLDTAPYSIAGADGLIGGDEFRSHDLAYIDRSGMIPGRDLKGGKTITLTIDVYADNEAAFNTAVSALQSAFAYPATVEAPLTFTIPGLANNTAAQINARPRRLALPYQTGWRSGRAARAVVELYASDGAKYSATEHATSITLSASVGGFSFPETFPLIFSGGVLGIKTITNAGNVPTTPRFVINGPVSGAHIRSETLDRDIEFGDTIVAGDYLVVDVANRAVLLNGTASRYDSLVQAEWFDLVPGTNEIRFTGTSGSSPVLNIYWKDAWL